MIAFRLDANEQIGSGHLQRCLPLAIAWRRLGREVRFFCRPEGFLQEKLSQEGFTLIPIPPLPLVEEARWMATALEDGYRLVLVDGYCYSNEYLETLCGPNRMVCAYDDDALYTYNCDVVINPHPFALQLPIQTGNRRPNMLLGSKYWVFRREFEETAPVKIEEKVSAVLVLMGGADVNAYVWVALEALAGLAVNVHVVLGPLTQYDDKLRIYAKSRPWLQLHKTPADIAGLMQSCDMAVSAGGNTLYELCVMGVPTIAVPQVHNEEVKVRYLLEDGVVLSPGNYQAADAVTLRESILALLESPQKRCALAGNARRLMLRGGTMRLIQALDNCAAKRV